FIALTFAWDKPESSQGLMKLPPRKPVTENSIKRIRTRELYRTPTITDPKTGQPVVPSKFSKFLHSLKKPFTKRWWSELFESTDEDLLVDGNILIWAYL